MTSKEILELGRIAKVRSTERMMKHHPEIVKAVRDESAAMIDRLEKALDERDRRIKELEADIERMNADKGGKRTRKGK